VGEKGEKGRWAKRRRRLARPNLGMKKEKGVFLLWGKIFREGFKDDF
jgi:hypothetical protein